MRAGIAVALTVDLGIKYSSELLFIAQPKINLFPIRRNRRKLFKLFARINGAIRATLSLEISFEGQRNK